MRKPHRTVGIRKLISTNVLLMYWLRAPACIVNHFPPCKHDLNPYCIYMNNVLNVSFQKFREQIEDGRNV